MVMTRDALRAVPSGRGTGLQLGRFFTTEGTHPYDELEWELRDAVITDYHTGAVAFEQRDVEFPTSWSMNATTVVAQKYFRGPLGSPQRERSVRQMIDRVADRITEWGRKDSYFADDESARIFNEELKAILVTQRAAFNSPVWFNVGVPDTPQQASACQPWHALVSTPDGYRPIGEIVEQDLTGSEIHDARGTTRVVAVKDNGVKRVHRVLLRDGTFVEATGDHLVRAVRQGGGPEWLRVDELDTSMRLQQQPHRPALGAVQADEMAVAEAALAGWLQSDGFVGQYETGTNRSLAIEFMTANVDEYAWVKQHLDVVFPLAHRLERPVDGLPEMTRIRMYGENLREFVERYSLEARGHDIRVPFQMWSAPLPVVTAYLQSMFQAEGYVSFDGSSALVGFAVISEQWTEDIQLLLSRLGIYSRRYRKREKREDRSDLWVIEIAYLSERDRFCELLPFIGLDKQVKLEASLDLKGKAVCDVRRVQIAEIIDLGEQRVYDIQTESGEYLSNSIEVHNCFILSVEDTMSSILNWYTEEGMIFKGGSGAGVNLSKIRSSKEHLAGGGEASGPVSFMRGADASAGTIKSGGKTRRAAKMVILDVDHPDIEEFIWCKSREEAKARALREAGFDMDLDGKDAGSVQYQNANNSVRVTDEFMRAVEVDAQFALKAVTTGEALETVKARELMRQIAQAAWECADPGMQYDTTINDWHTTPNAGRIDASNPCSEYMHLNNSACNLASLNLRRFESDGVFDTEGFKRAVEIVFTAQEIIVGNSSYPTEKIAQNARAYRQLGLGYANLGSLLMSQGLAYDSDEGRAWAGAITALMTGHAYRTSAELAKVQGPFDGYAADRDGMLRVIAKHKDACEPLEDRLAPNNILAAAREAWRDALEIGTEHGIRNAQASVLAPTGTISFLMDCDTTGIEPDLGLVKMKKLVGGGTMQIVNQTVPAALKKLGYQSEQIEAIVAYIDEHATIEGAPAFREEHLPVFDCAMGERSISPGGHIRMMAAVQPFISGALSKTVNLPESATVDDVEGIYIEGWKLGLKALAIYRDNCKVGQPLSIDKKQSEPASTTEQAEQHGMVRRRLPKQRPSQTISFQVGDAEGYLTAGEYPGDGLGEIFVKLGKQGSTLSGVMDAFAISVSLGLQYGVPLEAYVTKFTNMRFEPAGMTDDPEVKFTSSIVDYIFRRLAIEYLPTEKRHELNIHTLEERTAALDAGYPPADAAPQSPPADAEGQTVLPVDRPMPVDDLYGDAPMCFTCGIKMQRAGSCHVCQSCGTTSGCS